LSTAILLLTIVTLLLFPGAVAPRSTAAQIEPHDFRAYGMACKSCHASVGMKKRGVMRKPASEICTGCHKLPGHSHPVDIKPAMTVPPDLPLDINGMITCATCHDPHMAYLDSLTGEKTMYVRRGNTGRTFCAACHENLRSLL
jgi:predicted CXXCH cytochrome family protein